MSQVGVHPCAQDGFDGIAGALDLNKPIYYDEASGACMNSGYTPETMSYWILWGSPMDANELIKRTGGEMPVISFPFDRAPYPSYYGGAHGDDSLSAHVRQPSCQPSRLVAPMFQPPFHSDESLSAPSCQPSRLGAPMFQPPFHSDESLSAPSCAHPPDSLPPSSPI